jgi:hypothetical protein
MLLALYYRSCMKRFRPSDDSTAITIIGIKKYCKDCKTVLKIRPSVGKAKERFWFETTGFHA